MMDTTFYDNQWPDETVDCGTLSDTEWTAQPPDAGLDPLIRLIQERYHCPDEFFRFKLRDDSRSQQGYFQFGQGTLCYGHCSVPCTKSVSSGQFVDAAPEVRFDAVSLILPFDPNEVIDNLRWERYPASRLRPWDRLFKNIYYRVRPFTSRAVRKSVQKLRAAYWQDMSFPHWPVDATVETILETLLALSLRANGVAEIPFIWYWPEGARCCVTMTHDVETTAGRDICLDLLRLDQRHGIAPSFQLVPEERYELTPEFLKALCNGGAEICIQDLNHDGRLFDRRDEFLRRIHRINRYGRAYGAKGFRSAVLYRKPEWYGDLEFNFDMSIPNVAHLDPQRGGCCTVFPYFIGDILELPLTTVQDYTLWHVIEDDSIALWRLQLEMILARNGLASFLVHPDYITDAQSWGRYTHLLSMLESFRAEYPIWFASPSEIDTWWRSRHQMRIVNNQGKWRIVGKGAERAVLATARLRDGKLSYELESSR